ncbi:hypothetical protein [Polaromonas sp. JS666]|uniref:hypothetical protein n=1 Tax=Polaromonas sp. (strain JS666 / ATCC BAA-500) TaxID=296591 RepID=UPI000053376C|nr:hypothetical protein [Polaromonas sp. JS666]ABE42490.1 hypothetical protein Bpro_0527 [Polaromonas sp. JS666]
MARNRPASSWGHPLFRWALALVGVAAAVATLAVVVATAMQRSLVWWEMTAIALAALIVAAVIKRSNVQKARRRAIDMRDSALW